MLEIVRQELAVLLQKVGIRELRADVRWSQWHGAVEFVISLHGYHQAAVVHDSVVHAPEVRQHLIQQAFISLMGFIADDAFKHKARPANRAP